MANTLRDIGGARKRTKLGDYQLYDKHSFKLFSKNEPRVGIIIGTGPSLTTEQLDKVKSYRKFGANRAWEFDCDVVHGCNYQFWDHWWNKPAEFDHSPIKGTLMKDTKAQKWTTRPELEGKYDGLNYIKEIWIDGFSTDYNTISAHHGTGPQLLNLALHYGCKTMLLIGWDMCFPGKVDNRNYRKPRRFFGEDPLTEKHWPRTGDNGELSGLIKEVETIRPIEYGIDIINCTPGSALTCFPLMDLDDALRKFL